jgi:hypothetical protein
MKLQDLPLDVIPNILGRLDKHDIIKLSTLSSVFYQAYNVFFNCTEEKGHLNEDIRHRLSKVKNFVCSSASCSSRPILKVIAPPCTKTHRVKAWYGKWNEPEVNMYLLANAESLSRVKHQFRNCGDVEGDAEVGEWEKDYCVKGDMIGPGLWECVGHPNDEFGENRPSNDPHAIDVVHYLTFSGKLCTSISFAMVIEGSAIVSPQFLFQVRNFKSLVQK